MEWGRSQGRWDKGLLKKTPGGVGLQGTPRVVRSGGPPRTQLHYNHPVVGRAFGKIQSPWASLVPTKPECSGGRGLGI